MHVIFEVIKMLVDSVARTSWPRWHFLLWYVILDLVRIIVEMIYTLRTLLTMVPMTFLNVNNVCTLNWRQKYARYCSQLSPRFSVYLPTKELGSIFASLSMITTIPMYVYALHSLPTFLRSVNIVAQLKMQ